MSAYWFELLETYQGNNGFGLTGVAPVWWTPQD